MKKMGGIMVSKNKAHKYKNFIYNYFYVFTLISTVSWALNKHIRMIMSSQEYILFKIMILIFEL